VHGRESDERAFEVERDVSLDATGRDRQVRGFDRNGGDIDDGGSLGAVR